MVLTPNYKGVTNYGYCTFKESFDIPLHFDLSNDEISRVKKLVVKPELPAAEDRKSESTDKR